VASSEPEPERAAPLEHEPIAKVEPARRSGAVAKFFQGDLEADYQKFLDAIPMAPEKARALLATVDRNVATVFGADSEEGKVWALHARFMGDGLAAFDPVTPAGERARRMKRFVAPFGAPVGDLAKGLRVAETALWEFVRHLERVREDLATGGPGRDALIAASGWRDTRRSLRMVYALQKAFDSSRRYLLDGRAKGLAGLYAKLKPTLAGWVLRDDVADMHAALKLLRSPRLQLSTAQAQRLFTRSKSRRPTSAVLKARVVDVGAEEGAAVLKTPLRALLLFLRGPPSRTITVNVGRNVVSLSRRGVRVSGRKPRSIGRWPRRALVSLEIADSDFLVVRICKNHEPGAWVEVIELKLPKPARPGETVFRYSESKTVETVWAVRDLRRAGWNERH
jgi:hypothetical protein